MSHPRGGKIEIRLIGAKEDEYMDTATSAERVDAPRVPQLGVTDNENSTAHTENIHDDDNHGHEIFNSDKNESPANENYVDGRDDNDDDDDDDADNDDDDDEMEDQDEGEDEEEQDVEGVQPQLTTALSTAARSGVKKPAGRGRPSKRGAPPAAATEAGPTRRSRRRKAAEDPKDYIPLAVRERKEDDYYWHRF